MAHFKRRSAAAGERWTAAEREAMVAARRAEKQRTCAQCGTLFTARAGDERFCSRGCANKARASDAGKTRVCPVCSSTFRVDAPSRPKLTCSRACGQNARRRGMVLEGPLLADVAEAAE